MEALAEIAQTLDQQPFDEAVDVLVGSADETRVGPRLFEQRRQGRLQQVGLRGRQHPRARQRSRPREAAGHIVFEQAAIDGERRAPREDRRVGSAVESTGPERRHDGFASVPTSVAASEVRACGDGSLRPTMRCAPLNSFNRTSPVTHCCTLSTNASSAP